MTQEIYLYTHLLNSRYYEASWKKTINYNKIALKEECMSSIYAGKQSFLKAKHCVIQSQLAKKEPAFSPLSRTVSQPAYLRVSNGIYSHDI